MNIPAHDPCTCPCPLLSIVPLYYASDAQRKQSDMKEVEQQLREQVKWLATDSETWLKDLRERIQQLDRISDKSLR